ncbi:MAG TPA: galactokinase [Acidimicrobiia bacterium]|nr:galactokinase [Acidimicrobiia bacterium]
MIITRTPMRISLGGGGTDLPAYYRKAGKGFLIAAAISKYVYIAVNRTFDDSILLKYSQLEHVDDPADVKHPLLRECMMATGVTRSLEISAMADIPAGTGLGSSGAFTVGVLKALHAYRHEIEPNERIASRACDIEIGRLGEPSGKQDPYIAAIGGLTAFEFHADESVAVIPVPLADGVRHRIEENLVLFYTGLRRPASEVLAIEQSARSDAAAKLDENLDAVRAIGYETMDALTAGHVGDFGELLTRQWRLKLDRSPTPTHQRVDDWIARGVDAGAAGGKLVGAGGGGFLLFYAEYKADLRDAMAELGLPEVRFAFDYHGTTTIIAG